MNLKVIASKLGEFNAISQRMTYFFSGSNCSTIKIESNQTNLDQLVITFQNP